MRLVTICLIGCVISCAARSKPVSVAPESAPIVDPLADIVAIPPGLCPGLDDHYALTTNAVRQLLIYDREIETQHRLEMLDVKGDLALAELQRDRALEESKSAGWFAKWGLLVGLAGGLITTTVATVTIWSVSHASQ